MRTGFRRLRRRQGSNGRISRGALRHAFVFAELKGCRKHDLFACEQVRERTGGPLGDRMDELVFDRTKAHLRTRNDCLQSNQDTGFGEFHEQTTSKLVFLELKARSEARFGCLQSGQGTNRKILRDPMIGLVFKRTRSSVKAGFHRLRWERGFGEGRSRDSTRRFRLVGTEGSSKARFSCLQRNQGSSGKAPRGWTDRVRLRRTQGTGRHESAACSRLRNRTDDLTRRLVWFRFP